LLGVNEVLESSLNDLSLFMFGSFFDIFITIYRNLLQFYRISIFIYLLVKSVNQVSLLNYWFKGKIQLKKLKLN